MDAERKLQMVWECSRETSIRFTTSCSTTCDDVCTRTHCERRSKFALSFSRFPIGGSIHGQTKVSINIRFSEMCSRKMGACRINLFFPEIWGNMFKSTYKYEVLYVFVKSSYFRRFWKWCSRRFRSILTEIFMQWKFEKKLDTHQLIFVRLIPILVKKNASGRRESAPQLHDWKKKWVILKPQNFHGSENFLEMILPQHIYL